MQHGMIDYQVMVTMLRASPPPIDAAGAGPWNDPAHIQKALDAGA